MAIETPSSQLLADNLKYCVYALMCEDDLGRGFVKIGYSKNIGKRLSSIRTGCPIPAKMIAIIDVGDEKYEAENVEEALHEEFSDRNTTGEWFSFDFQDPRDKLAFRDGCKSVFARFNLRDRWWTPISVKALDSYAENRKKMLAANRDRFRLIERAKWRERKRKAWKELSGNTR